MNSSRTEFRIWGEWWGGAHNLHVCVSRTGHEFVENDGDDHVDEHPDHENDVGYEIESNRRVDLWQGGAVLVSCQGSQPQW